MPVPPLLTILAVEDLARAREFYERAFGWTPKVAFPVYAEYAVTGGASLGLYERRSFGKNTGRVPARVAPGEIAGTEVYFRVDDLEGTIDRLTLAGASTLSPLALRPWGEEVAYFADLDGNVVAVTRSLGKG